MKNCWWVVIIVTFFVPLFFALGCGTGTDTSGVLTDADKTAIQTTLFSFFEANRAESIEAAMSYVSTSNFQAKVGNTPYDRDGFKNYLEIGYSTFGLSTSTYEVSTISGGSASATVTGQSVSNGTVEAAPNRGLILGADISTRANLTFSMAKESDTWKISGVTTGTYAVIQTSASSTTTMLLQGGTYSVTGSPNTSLGNVSGVDLESRAVLGGSYIAFFKRLAAGSYALTASLTSTGSETFKIIHPYRVP